MCYFSFYIFIKNPLFLDETEDNPPLYDEATENLSAEEKAVNFTFFENIFLKHFLEIVFLNLLYKLYFLQATIF